MSLIQKRADYFHMFRSDFILPQGHGQISSPNGAKGLHCDVNQCLPAIMAEWNTCAQRQYVSVYQVSVGWGATGGKSECCLHVLLVRLSGSI